jgi:hypothetical protein
VVLSVVGVLVVQPTGDHADRTLLGWQGFHPGGTRGQDGTPSTKCTGLVVALPGHRAVVTVLGRIEQRVASHAEGTWERRGARGDRLDEHGGAGSDRLR